MDAEDVEVAAAELCGFAPLHSVRCPAFHTQLQGFFSPGWALFQLRQDMLALNKGQGRERKFLLSQL